MSNMYSIQNMPHFALVNFELRLGHSSLLKSDLFRVAAPPRSPKSLLSDEGRRVEMPSNELGSEKTLCQRLQA